MMKMFLKQSLALLLLVFTTTSCDNIMSVVAFQSPHVSSPSFVSTSKKTTGLSTWNHIRNGPKAFGNAATFHLFHPRSSPQASKSSRLSMVNYEELMERLPSKKVIQAVDNSPSEKVVASDIAAAAGVSITQARKDLTTLASLSQGDIAVSNDGELIYTFPSQVSSVLTQKSQSYKLRKIWTEQIFPKLFYGVRVSFGIALLVSIFAIFSTIAVISSSGSSSDRDDRNDRRGGNTNMSFGFGGGFWGPSPFDFLYYRPYGYYGYYAPPGSASYRDPDEMGFLESVFSYIFGDGNPNQDVEERQLRLVSNLIRENNGAVTAEQLAPLILEDLPPIDVNAVDDVNSVRYVDESFVLPIVTQLNGEPRVTEDGDIVYIFPELQVSAQSNIERQLVKAGLEADASASSIKNALIARGVSPSVFLRGFERNDVLAIFQKSQYLFEDDEDLLNEESLDLIQEREYKFSLASDTNKLLAAGLGALNLGGALYLGKLLSSYAMYGVQLPSYYGLVQSGFPLLLGYAILYNVIPLARNVIISNRNKEIAERNAIRRKWRTALLASTAGRIGRKLKEAKKMGIQMKQLGAAGKEDVVFDTKQSAEEVKKSREKDALAEFDKLLGEEEPFA